LIVYLASVLAVLIASWITAEEHAEHRARILGEL
jgi:hypothetical protein